jgi:hypothetical protein
LSLSNAALDHLLKLAAGHGDKVWSGTRGLSQDMIDKMLSGLGLKLLVAIDPEGVARVRHRWERRDERAVRAPARIGKELVARARPAVLRQLASKAATTRWSRTTPETRRAIMAAVTLARANVRARESADAAAERADG